MNQAEFLRQFDADASAAFRDAGIADAATYTASGGAPVDCSALIDRDMTTIGDFAPISARSARITLFRVDVAQPSTGGVVAVGADRYTLQTPIRDDESRTEWVARRE